MLGRRAHPSRNAQPRLMGAALSPDIIPTQPNPENR